MNSLINGRKFFDKCYSRKPDKKNGDIRSQRWFDIDIREMDQIVRIDES